MFTLDLGNSMAPGLRNSELGALRRNNKSMELYLKGRTEKESPDFTKEQLAYLDELAEKLGIIADKMTGLNKLVSDKDKKEEKAIKDDRALKRMRSIGGMDFGKTLEKKGLLGAIGNAVLGEVGGGAGTGSWSGYSSKDGSEESEEDSLLKDIGSSILTSLGISGAGKLGKKGLEKILKGRLGELLAKKVPGGKWLLKKILGNNLKNIKIPKRSNRPWEMMSKAEQLVLKSSADKARLDKAIKIGKGTAVLGSIFGTAAGAYQIFSADSKAKSATSDIISSVDTNTPGGRLLQAGIGNSVYAQNIIAREKGSGVGTIATSIAGSIGSGALAGTVGGGPIGTALGALAGLGFGLFGSLFGEAVADVEFQNLLKKLGLKQEDVDLALAYARGENVEAQFEEMVNMGKITLEEAKIRLTRADRALKTVLMGIGDYRAPETWPADFGIADKNGDIVSRTDKERVESLPGIFRKPLHEAVSSYYTKLVEAVANLDATKKLPMDQRRSYIEQGVKKNRAKLGLGADGTKYYSEINNAVGYDRPGSPSDRNTSASPYATGLAMDIQSYDWLDAELKARGIKRIKGDPRPLRYFNTKAPGFKKLVESGLWTESPNGSAGLISRGRVAQTIAPGKEPEYLAMGGVLNSATYLGKVNDVNSLEESGEQIAGVLKDGLERISNEDGSWFDNALMSYFMNGLLPGLVSALKNDKEEMGEAYSTTVEVFG